MQKYSKFLNFFFN